ncbi:MAG: DsbE family thiol:disulfide interchange protein [Alphaproteobacteria bacterium]|nr:DsbE family thiol:disulfide interchange protein [Alphaproteobacteria bacterium]
MRRGLLWIPLGIFALLLVVAAFALRNPADPTIRSRLVGKPMPDFALAPSQPGHPGLAAADLRRGQPRLVNVFASWCVPCRIEAPVLTMLKQRGVPIDAIAVRDRPEDVAAFLADNGDPFERIGDDPRTRVQFALGSSGVPETFLVDGRGIIRLQHIGPINADEADDIYRAWRDAK